MLFCYHSKNKSAWEIKRGGDYEFVKTLISKNNLKIGKIRKVLTRSISLDIICGEGSCNDL